MGGLRGKVFADCPGEILPDSSSESDCANGLADRGLTPLLRIKKWRNNSC